MYLARADALTPSPSPTLWERGVRAHGGAPCRAFPLSRPAGEGDTGGEGKKARLPVHACAGKIAPAAAILHRTVVPLSAHPQPLSHAVGEGSSRFWSAEASASASGRSSASARHKLTEPYPGNHSGLPLQAVCRGNPVRRLAAAAPAEALQISSRSAHLPAPLTKASSMGYNRK